MKYIFSLFCALACCLLAENEQIILQEKTIHTIAPFEQVDYFSTYTREGEFLWEIPFPRHIVSCEADGEYFFILSKVRDGSALVFTCVNISTGEIKWERGIYAPASGGNNNL